MILTVSSSINGKKFILSFFDLPSSDLVLVLLTKRGYGKFSTSMLLLYEDIISYIRKINPRNSDLQSSETLEARLEKVKETLVRGGSEKGEDLLDRYEDAEQQLKEMLDEDPTLTIDEDEFKDALSR